MKSWILIGLSMLAGLANANPDAAWKIEKNCDIPSENLAQSRQNSLESCQQSCVDHKQCQAFVYVSGWQRCFLKEQSKRRARVQLISADVRGQDSNLIAKPHVQKDFDHSGKDLQRVETKQVEVCAKACQDRSDCFAFTKIDGYGVCWLKAAGGKAFSKVFHCGYRQ